MFRLCNLVVRCATDGGDDVNTRTHASLKPRAHTMNFQIFRHSLKVEVI